MSLQIPEPYHSLESLVTVAELSLSSLLSVSDSSFASDTTESYGAAGPGAWTGKVIYQLGKQTLKGLEHISIVSRLTGIRRQSPHEITLEMCDDMLELCRPDIYSRTLHLKAMKLLERQVISENTKFLLDVLVTWRTSEISYLFLELLQNCRDLVILDKTDSSLTDNNEKLISFVQFFHQLSSLGPRFCRIMLDCGYLCLLQQLSVSAVNYLLRPHFWGVLQALSDNAVDISAKIDHNLMWDVNSLTESYPEFILNSSFTLIEASGADHLRGDLQFPALRALQMLIYQTDKITYTLKSLLLHDFKAESSPEKEQDYDKENSFCILMELYLRKAQNNHVANVFTRIVHRLSLLVNDSSLPLLDFFLVDDMLTFRRTAVVHFIHWFIKNSSVDLHLRQLLIRANIIYLIESAISAENIYPLDPSDRTASLYRQEVLSWAKEVFKTTYKVINLPRLKYDA